MVCSVSQAPEARLPAANVIMALTQWRGCPEQGRKLLARLCELARALLCHILECIWLIWVALLYIMTFTLILEQHAMMTLSITA